jgi:hypothetical protein
MTGLVVSVMGLAACGPQIRYSATNTPPTPPAPKAPEQVELLDSEPERPFLVIGVLTGRGDNKDEVVTAMRARAGKAGCDAMVTVASGGSEDGQRGAPKHQAACVIWTEGEVMAKKEPEKKPEPPPEAPAEPPPATEPVASEKPEGAAGFLFGQALDVSQKMCRDAKHRWKQVKGARYSCSGTGTSLPPMLRLRFCGGRLCEVIVESDRTDAAVPWTDHFAKSREPLVAKYGEPKKATSEVPADCAADALSGCVAQAKAKLANEWWWSTGERVVHQLAPNEAGKAAVEQVVYSKWPLDPPADGAAPAADTEPAAPPSGG